MTMKKMMMKTMMMMMMEFWIGYGQTEWNFEVYKMEYWCMSNPQ